MQLVNLTPHAIHIHDPDEGGHIATLQPSGTEARVAERLLADRTIRHDGGAHIPCLSVSYGAPQNLPAPQEGTAYLVSMLVRQAAPGRLDLYSPGSLIRDEDGRITGCYGLRCNAARRAHRG